MGEKTFLIEMGERICIKRKANGITQEKLAEKMGVSLQTVSNIECGKKSTKPENIAKICSILNTTADYILLGERGESETKELTKMLATLPEEKYAVIEKLICFLSFHK